MNNVEMSNIEILVVNNGFMVRPPYGHYREGVSNPTQIHVFETFQALVEFLKKNLLPRMEGIADV